MSKSLIKSKQLENVLSDRIQSLYYEQLKHKLEDINYHFFDNTLIIMMEGSLTQPEKLLNENEHEKLAKQVREVIDRLIQPQIKSSIEEVMNVKVVDFLCDTTIDTSRTGAIAILGLKPRAKNHARANISPPG